MLVQSRVRIGLTGSSGFLGSAILKHFQENGVDIVVIDNLVHPNAKGTSLRAKEGFDWVLHFGATKSIEASFKNPMDIYKRNMHSTMAALDIAVSRNSRFLYMSSYVYGNPLYKPIDEKHPVSVLNPYMGSKLLAEQMCFQLHQCIGLSVLILRGFTFYGPGQKGDQFIPSIIESIKNNRPIVVKDPNPKRDYLFIGDFLQLIDSIVGSEYSGFEIYNVGGGNPYQNIEVARIANELARNLVPICIQGKERRNDVSECYANIDKVSHAFNWYPKTDLLSGLHSCLSFNQKSITIK